MNLDVVIVTYNSGPHLPAVVGALPDDVNVIVIDNASRDDSLDVARELGIKVIENATNAGFASAANRGATRGHHELILFLNPDAVVDAATITRLMAEFDDPSVAVASPQLRRPDGKLQRTTWPYPSSARAWLDALKIPSRRRRSGQSDIVVGAVFMCRRSAFEQVGGFDARFWLYGEEVDLCRRLREAGWDLRLVSEVEAIHAGKASWTAGASVAREHRRRGGEHFIAKHEGRLGLLSYRLARLVGAALRVALPGPALRRAHHREQLVETATALARSPLRVAVDSPMTRVPGAGIVVLSTTRWYGPDRTLQQLLEDLLDVEPERRILYVEPAYSLRAQLSKGRRSPREASLRPVHADGRIVRFQPLELMPFPIGRLRRWLVHRQLRRALRLFGLDGPTYVVADPNYRDAVSSWGVPAVIEPRLSWPRGASLAVIDDDRTQRLERLQAELKRARDGASHERFRVLYFSHRGEIAGNAHALQRLLGAMGQVDAHVVLGQDGPARDWLSALGVSVEVLGIAPELVVDAPRAQLAGRVSTGSIRSMLRNGRALSERIRALEPDVIHTTTITAGILGGLAGRRAGVPVVWQLRDGVNSRTMSRTSILALRLAGRLLASAIVTNSRATWHALGLDKRGPGTASRVIGDLVIPDETPAPGSGDAPITVVVVSRLVHWKGQQVFLDAFAKAFAGGDERAIIVGRADDQRYADDLVTQVDQLGLTGRVTFTGFVDDVGPILDEADVLVHAATRPEPFPQVIVEGMAKGLAVVASESTGTAELITDGMDGLLCPPSDVEAIAGRLQLLAGDPALRRRLGAAANRRARAFGPDAVAAQMGRTYRQVVTRARHRR